MSGEADEAKEVKNVTEISHVGSPNDDRKSEHGENGTSKSQDGSEKIGNGKTEEEASNAGQKRKAQDEDILNNSKSDASTVAEHYNKIKSIGKEGREVSQILGVRNFNNWVKSVLINEFCNKGDGAHSVLDLACGKGGDLTKWKRTRIRGLTGVDIAAVSIEEAQKRYNEMRPRFKADFAVLDAFHNNWHDCELLTGKKFDLISCQFALHYCFETEESAKHTMKSISEHLKSGGHFFGTIPNFSATRRKLLQSPEAHQISNSIYKLTLDEGTGLDPGYGQRYYFELSEAIECCPEYFIPFPLLESLAEEHGMEATLELPFQAFFEEYSGKHQDLLIRMGIWDVRNDRMMLSPDELEVAELYMAFCFTKK